MTTTGPRVTIVTPSFNQAQFLEETIQSVLQQNYPDLEYIIIDGGSTDGSVDIIRKYADRIAYWHSEPDNGQAAAINKGFRNSRGDILAWINSDDTYKAGAVAQAVRALETNPEQDLVYGHCEYVDTQGQILQEVFAWDFVPRRLLTGIPYIIQPACFFRRRAFEQVGALDETLQYLMDHDLFVRMVLAGSTFLKVDEVWSCYRWHSSAKTYQQWVGFQLELQQIVERTFSRPVLGLPMVWRREARANAWQWLGEAYLKSNQPRQARAALFQAIKTLPIRPKTLMALALLVDASLGTSFNTVLRRLRYYWPDAPAGAQPFDVRH
jgi:glycosyltransferase involved in cell wall biosynthesis